MVSFKGLYIQLPCLPHSPLCFSLCRGVWDRSSPTLTTDPPSFSPVGISASSALVQYVVEMLAAAGLCSSTSRPPLQLMWKSFTDGDVYLNPILTGEKHMLESSPWFPLRPEFTDADFYLLARLRPQGLESTCPGVRGAMERSENSCTVGAVASQAQHDACTAWFLTFTASCGVCPFFLHTDGGQGLQELRNLTPNHHCAHNQVFWFGTGIPSRTQANLDLKCVNHVSVLGFCCS